LIFQGTDMVEYILCYSAPAVLLASYLSVGWLAGQIHTFRTKHQNPDRVNTLNFLGLKTVAGESAVNAARYRNYRNKCRPVQLGGERRESARYKEERFLMTTFVFWT
jgi:hypothetical protein